MGVKWAGKAPASVWGNHHTVHGKHWTR